MSQNPATDRSIFLAAIDIAEPAERDAFVEQACGENASLRSEVLALLAAHGQSGDLLDAPDISRTIDRAPSECPGTQIGPYRLLQQIGEGGMGVVYMAEQSEPVKRRVALKIIKPGMDTRQVIARFEAEKQALGLMDHANIARVLDAGTTEQGRPYFVMELVHGVPITKYCDDNRLTPRQRLELFVPVCQAIQHAHQKGIIHRDIKPSNVMVTLYDGKPVPKVIDFGVAKATEQKLTERTLFTQYGTMVGTLEYMSPEQAEMSALGVDTRSDIFSLGVLLYELLTGSTPLSSKRMKEAAYAEILRMIKEEEPPKPSTRLSDSGEALASISANRHTEPAKLTKLVRGELDWIVMKALEKDRNRRYETANGLAMDLQRYLVDEPVQACPPSVGYRLRKFVRRNKGPAVAVSLVLLALVAGILGTSWGLVRADKARRDAVAAQLAEADRADGERRAKEAETALRQRAEDNAKLALAVLDEIFLKEARRRLTLSSKEEAKGIAKNPEREKLEREFLEKGLTFYEQLAQTNATDWTARRERAKAYANVGLLRLDLKNYVESEKAYRQAVRLMEELAGERPDDFDNSYDLAQAYHWGYRAYWDSGRLQPAEEMTRQALSQFDKLGAAFPDRRPQFLGSICACQRNLALVLQKAAKPEEAEKAFQQALALWAELVKVNAELAAANPDAPEPRSAVARTHYEMAGVLRAAGQLDEAEKAYRQAIATWQKLATDVADKRYANDAAYALSRIVHIDWDRGSQLQGAGKLKEAEECYRRALAICEQLAAGDHPEVAFYRQEQAVSHRTLAQLLKHTGRIQEVEKAYRQALTIHEKLVADFPNNGEYRARLSQNLGELADNLLQQGKHAEAATIAEKIASVYAKDANGYQKAALVSVQCMALASKDAALSEADRAAVAQPYADRARALTQEAARRGLDTAVSRELQEALRLPTDDPRAHYLLGVALFTQGMFAAAEAECREALRLRSDYVEARVYLGRALTDQGKYAEAEAEFREALRLRPGYRPAHHFVGYILGVQGKYAAAVRFYIDSFAADPTLADVRSMNRYNAACAAALLGCGQDRDAAGLDDAERARLRRQALDWLRADLAAWGQLLEKEPDQARPRVQQTLRHWQQDGDFAGVRGDALAKLPEAERQAWQQLWADVEETLTRANDKDSDDLKKKPTN